MKRILSLLTLTLVLLITACNPELIPAPVTPGPSLPPPTPTPEVITAPVAAQPDLVTIHMIDEQNGWGISNTNVLRTNDGGNTWHNLSPENAGSLGYAVSSAFLDAKTAWVLVPDPNNMLAGTLYHTMDGGLTWSATQVPFGGGPMHFLSPKQGWMMASLGAGAGSMGVAIFQTNDGGATWTESYTNDPNQPDAGGTLPLGGLKDGLTAFDMQTAWVGGVTYAPGVIYLYVTQDGGKTWRQSPVQVPSGYDQAEFETVGPTFVTASAAYMPVHVSSQNGVLLAVYVSHDNGQSWTQTPTMIPMGGSMDFVTGVDGFIWNGTDFYVTRDGAQTWTTVTPDVSFGDNFSSMDFVSPSTGFVVTSDASGASTLYKTEDGGATWNVLAH